MARASKERLDPREIRAFLPAALEIEQTPASPIGRAILWAIMLLFTLSVLWACVGRVDVVAVAQGKVLPSERVKRIQPLEAGIVSAIHVREGERVRAGEPLVTLDATATGADLARLREELAGVEAQAVRLARLEQAFRQNLANPAPIDAAAIPDPALRAAQEQLLAESLAELRARLRGLDQEAARLEAERRMTQAEVAKLERVLPLMRERVAASARMLEARYVPRVEHLALQQELIEQEQDLAAQRAALVRLDAALAANREQRAGLLHERRGANLAALEETRLRLRALAQEFAKAEQRHAQRVLRAPIAGTVEELAIHTVGGVVEPAQTLMRIVPEDSRLEVEVLVLNKDIGFVHPGQRAAVKVDTFNFTKYGLIDAELVDLSDDAIQHEQLGLVYRARLALGEEGLQVGEKWVRLAPGMSVTSEIKTGERRLIEYFLSPLLRFLASSNCSQCSYWLGLPG